MDPNLGASPNPDFHRTSGGLRVQNPMIHPFLSHLSQKQDCRCSFRLLACAGTGGVNDEWATGMGLAYLPTLGWFRRLMHVITPYTICLQEPLARKLRSSKCATEGTDTNWPF